MSDASESGHLAPTVTSEGMVIAVESAEQSRPFGCWAQCGVRVERGDPSIEVVPLQGGRLVFHPDCYQRSALRREVEHE